MTKSLFLLSTLAMATAATASAQAPKRIDVVGQRIAADQLVERVSHGDLNLVGASGQKLLNRRVGLAVSRVCAPLNGTNLRIDRQECRSFAWNGARPQMAQAITRAQQLAATGHSDLPEIAITVSAPTAG